MSRVLDISSPSSPPPPAKKRKINRKVRAHVDSRCWKLRCRPVDPPNKSTTRTPRETPGRACSCLHHAVVNCA